MFVHMLKTGGISQKWPSHKYANSLNDMEIRVQSVTGCMGGPETEVELGGDGVAGSVMTPRMHQSNGRRSFCHFSNANFSSFVMFPFTAQSAARYSKETFCDGLSVL